MPLPRRPLLERLCDVITRQLIVCRQLGLLGTDLHAVGCGGFVETLN